MKRILLVDDSRTVLMSLDSILTRAGFQTERQPSAEAALAHLQGGARPDLVITDLNMGAMTGIDLIRAARKLPASRFTPMLVLTTESAQGRRDEARAAGATGWLVKPVVPDRLLAAVRQILPGT